MHRMRCDWKNCPNQAPGRNRRAFFKRHDLPSQVEPRVVGKRLKHDVEVVDNGSSCSFDVPLVSPVEATYAQRASEDVVAALRSRELQKITKYSDVACEAGGVVLPFEGIWLRQGTAKHAAGSFRPLQRQRPRIKNSRGTAC